jgi:hypothetical protein
MKKYWGILRTLTFIIVGVFNTALIRPEDIGTWKNYTGYALLTIGIIDAFFLIKNYLNKRKYV